jgi:methylglutaconyl-CoA hydratase
METVISQLDDRGVATLTLNRPEKANAYDDQVIYSLITALDDYVGVSDLKMLVLKSNGKHFSSGVDIDWVQDVTSIGIQANRNDATQLARLMATLYHFPVPIIAAVQGNAYSSAVGVLACADVVIAASDSRFYLNDVKYGLAPAVTSPYLVKAIGERLTRYYALTARPISAMHALRIGLINQMVEPAELDQSVEVLIEEMLTLSPTALRQTKAILQYSANEIFDDAMVDVTIDYLAELRMGDDCQEGIRSFLQKRKPKWS